MKILILSLLVVSLQAGYFTKSQKDNLNIAYNIGKQISAKDGMTFENTLRSIAFTESSAGENIIGDRHWTRQLSKASLGTYQVRVMTAKEVIKKDKFMNKHFSYLLEDEDKLIRMLLEENEFGALVAGHYLKMNYNYAVKKGIDPYFYTVSRYNGGSNNTVYVERIRNNIKKIKKEI